MSRVRGEIRTENLSLGIVHREMGNESTVRDALKKFIRIKPSKTKDLKINEYNLI